MKTRFGPLPSGKGEACKVALSEQGSAVLGAQEQVRTKGYNLVEKVGV
jgi:hypothetical protein